MVQYLFNNRQNAIDDIMYSEDKLEKIFYKRGEIAAYDDILGFCDYMDRLKIASEDDKKRLEMLKKTEPMQAVVEGKTFFTKEHVPSKEDLGL